MSESSNMDSQATQQTPVRGRKKFLLDVQHAAQRCSSGWFVKLLRADNLRFGEDEGSVLCEISHRNKHLMTLSIHVSDTSDYPKNHSFFCCTTSEGEVDPGVLSILDAASGERKCTIEAFLWRLLVSCSEKLADEFSFLDEVDDSPEEVGWHDESSQEDGSGSDMYDSIEDDLDYGIAPGTTKSGVNVSVLQRDFNEIVACNYRPGLIQVGSSEIAVSISKPAFKLADTIPAQALSAWDSRLLSNVKHLTLIITGIRGVYPILQTDGSLNHLLNGVTFKVGLTRSCKPDSDLVRQLSRTFANGNDLQGEAIIPDQTMEDEVDESFSFSLSSSLEALMNDRFLDLLQIRIRYGFGWAAAEALLSEVYRTQGQAEDISQQHAEALLLADKQERNLAHTNRLPDDPLQAPDRDGHHNVPLYAFSYLLRRLTLCTRYCLVCYNKLQTEFQTLKPYVCDNKLCTYQYYNLNRGPSLEYEICSKPETVDLLVSLAYSAASLHTLHGFPDGLGLQVPSFTSEIVDFDVMDPLAKDAAIMTLLSKLPRVSEMKKQLEKCAKAGLGRITLKDMNPDVPAASWQLLRWCVASCTALLEELTSEEERIIGVDPSWRQYRFTVGAPDAEAKFRAAQVEAQRYDLNAQRYPSLYAFHGSPTNNWHSIIRNGLWCKEVVHGRVYGDGVYFAKDGGVCISSYSRFRGETWAQSDLQVSACVALAEIVNLPELFRSFAPYFVVQQTDWIVCRYLLVDTASEADKPPSPQRIDFQVPLIDLDPKHPPMMRGRRIEIPNPKYRLEKLVIERNGEYIEEEYDEEDAQVFFEKLEVQEACPIAVERVEDEEYVEDGYAYGPEDSDLSYEDAGPKSSSSDVSVASAAPVQPPEEDWVHDPSWVAACIQHVLPPPNDASRMATTTLQRELRRILKEQEDAKSLKELGWYMPPEFIGDNLFQWIAELHSFDPEIPIAQDMKARNVNSIVFEISFPPTFPHSPPFFRILKPRFLPFSLGGGGHVTGGGSMCMDLLTSDGWLPSYTISAVLLQIKLAISNLDPRPGRLARNWDSAYTMSEAIQGYKRVAQAHGWKIPQEIDQYSRGSWN